jgi:CubicO group peptidase (beta-lactamase class C family)
MQIKNILLFLFTIVVVKMAAQSQVITSYQIDSLVELTLKTFDVPGIAVAVVKDGQIVHAKGYGVRSLNTKEKVTEQTLFGIASNSKAFTAAALGMLQDEGKLTYDSKVRDFIPEFKMYDPYVTEEFTIRDLLTHRSGLGLGAGDLMFWPDSSNFTRKDIIHNLRYLKPVSSFRTKYDYDNLMYILAGEIITRVSGMPWEEFIQKRILTPLQMTSTAPSFSRVKDKSNVIDPHAPVDGKVQVIRRDWNETANAAGGLYSNVVDISKWIIMQMNAGKYGDNLSQKLFSEDVHADMWSPQTIQQFRGKNAYNTHFTSYGLGWGLSDVKGYKQATHTGGLAGIVTQVTIIPDIKLGIIVFTNQQSGAAFNSVTATIKDSYLGVTGMNRVKDNNDRRLKGEAEAQQITTTIWKNIEEEQKKNIGKKDNASMMGTYTDKWFGDVVILEKNGKLWFQSQRSFLLNGEMFAYKGNTYVVKWTDRSMDADAFAIFTLDSEGKPIGFKMNAISPLTDFSFDFQDLDFERKK